ncbi:hypothetical protein ACLMJK_007765 [Lecanora helva]
MDSPATPATPLLGTKPWSRGHEARRFLMEEVNVKNAYVPLLVCCFTTGLIDAGCYNAWSVFMGMQTGNTIFLALSTANLPADTDHLKWARSGISILTLMAGSFITGRIYAVTGGTRRQTLLISFIVQALCIAVAAVLVQFEIVPSSPPSSKLIFIAIPFLAAQSGAQIVTAKSLGFGEIPTTVLTSGYNDLASDTKLLAWNNPKRDRRFGSLVMMLLGGIAGAWISRSESGLAVVLWVGAGIKVLLALAWLGFSRNTG